MPLPPRKGAKAPDQLVSGTKADGYEQGPCTRLEDETPLGMSPRKGAKARQKFAKAPVPPEPPADGYEGPCTRLEDETREGKFTGRLVQCLCKSENSIW